MSASAVVMMVVYLGLVGGGLLLGMFLMATHSDETAGKLGHSEAHQDSHTPVVSE